MGNVKSFHESEPKPKKRRMSLDYAVKYKRRLEGRFTTFANLVYREQWSEDYIREVWFRAVCAGSDWERAPGWVKQFASGWYACFTNEMWQRHTAWHVWLDGKHYRTRTHGGTDDAILEGRWSEVEGNKGASLWLSTGKVWSGYDPTGEAQRVPTEDEIRIMRRTWGEP